ncbi:YncE family protein [Actinoplanes sp. NPDC051513]|uniref:YncE family protein n=1 Tax=Actinoplanes sp. NPDC051513 TaxID=3363908 RepID=UPI0037AD6B42
MPLRRSSSALALLGLTAAAALNAVPTTASAHGRSHDTAFKRLATFPAYLNSAIDDAAAAEISTVTEDGRTVVYTDSPGKRLGFVDITNPGKPSPAGTLAVGGEPISVAHLGHLLLAGVNTRESFTNPSGKLVVVDDRNRKVVREIDLGGQPDSVAVAPNPRKPRFEQLLPTAAGPEGVVAVPSRGLVIVSSETDDPDNNLRGAVNI